MPIISNSKGTIKVGNFELPIISMDISYARFTEYGYPPEHANCKASSENFIDSTAIVIDENVLALPAPGQKVVVEDDL